MQCSRKTAVLAPMGFGGILAFYAYNMTAPETPLSGRAVRGTGGIIKSTVDALGPNGAAVAFLMLGAVMAVVSAMLCPSSRQRR